MDGMSADAIEKPLFALAMTQSAVAKINTAAMIVGGLLKLKELTGYDVEHMHNVLNNQLHSILTCLQPDMQHPLTQIIIDASATADK